MFKPVCLRYLGFLLLFLPLLGQASDLQAYQGDSPFDLYDGEELRKSPKKVFAHYLSVFPLSIDNQPPDSDYYARHYLNPQGEKGKHAGYGGFIRQRPLPRSPRPGVDWLEQDLKDELRLASDIGLDGFSFNILSLSGRHWERLETMLKVAHEQSPDFKIMLMPDMVALKNVPYEKLSEALWSISQQSAVLKSSDGRVVIAPFNAHNKTAKFWQQLKTDFSARGSDIFFLPTFQGWWKFIDQYRSVSDGFSDWGAGSLKGALSLNRVKAPERVHDLTGKIWMAPVRPQDFRPRSYKYFEAGNSELFRTMWSTAIEGKADWVQLISWNDHAEGTAIRPSTKTRSAFYQLSAFYTQWFKTGVMPTIRRDAIFCFYRIHSTQVKPDLSRQLKLFDAAGEPQNEIELLAFLARPGQLEIEIGGQISRREAPAGITSFKVPLRNGTPVFRVSRAGIKELELIGREPVGGGIVYQDLLYRSDYLAAPY
ncbi:hypothetical protein DXV75_03100 [Alteromonas aestuariivivens]|uniref:Glycosyl hydrolase family 71 n=1 Tax=Alteromonas aestuariivivens TaxID=1938339 RepID=A0A3D8MCL0_9ALTE|nr:glycoside hydrolase family 71 protein [Alteromonas aestuariivivens]RDV27970.1 hypothetical protein DXV75_03100 [Alteromonas aestuariivivens]